MTELSFDDFSQLSLRLRSPAPFNQMYLSFNPVSKANWRYKYFFETEAPAGCKIHQTTYKDNNYLPSEYVASLKDLETRNPIYYKIYVLGEFPTQRTAYLLGNGVFFEDNNTKHALGGASLDTNLYFAAKSALDQGMAYGFWIYDHIDFFERLEFCKLWDEEDGSLKAGIRFWDLILKKARKSADFESFNKVVLELQKLRDTFTTEVESQLENLEMGGASYRKVSKLAKPLTEDEIIKKISGTDKTKGSCASLALAYVANKMGLDVTDYRDGSSLNHFAAGGAHELVESVGIKEKAVTKNWTFNNDESAKKILNGLVLNKQYLMCTGCHAAIIRKVPSSDRKRGWKLEYLELQDPERSGYSAGDSVYYNNGWKSEDLYCQRL